MEVNLPIWGYYNQPAKAGQPATKFIDPMYVPYQPSLIYDANSDQMCPINEWAFVQQRDKKSNYDSGRVRQNMGWTFQRQNPSGPCPEGWTKSVDGYCIQAEPESRGTMYTDKHFAPMYQYWDAYTTETVHNPEISPFDMFSINPYSGEMEQYFTSKTKSHNSVLQKYRTMPSTDSLLP